LVPPEARDSSTEKLILIASKYLGSALHNQSLPLCAASCRVLYLKDPIEDAVLTSAAALILDPLHPTVPVPKHKPAGQRWLFTFNYEAQHYAGAPSPRGGQSVQKLDKHIDWTMTFSHRSDFFNPMYRFMQTDDVGMSFGEQETNAAELTRRNLSTFAPALPRDGATGPKTILLAWMVSNCGGARFDLWQRLASLLPKDRVVMYGQCPGLGHVSDPCPGDREDDSKCWRAVFAKVKFYYAAENSRCEGYITEKFARPLRSSMVPLALGGLGREDYEYLAPKDAFLHVDDFQSVEALARYLTEIDRDDKAFDRFFDWRKKGYHVITWDKPVVQLCGLCKQLHLPEDAQKTKHRFGDLHHWWYDETCRSPEEHFGGGNGI